MSNLGEKISVVKTGDELFDVWRDLGQRLPRTAELREQWREAIDSRALTFLAARVGDLAVAQTFIKWGGPVNRENLFAEILEEEYPDAGPIPTLYSLFVTEAARGHQLGRKLTIAAENNIKRRKNVERIAAAWVETDNKHSLPIMVNRGFKILPTKRPRAVILDRPTESGKSASKKPVYIMAKDLSA
jgi:GNAT superfamily N-acetyltransferase